MFFGGGAPSLMATGTVEAIIEAIGGFSKLDTTAAIALEGKPTRSSSR